MSKTKLIVIKSEEYDLKNNKTDKVTFPPDKKFRTLNSLNNGERE